MLPPLPSQQRRQRKSWRAHRTACDLALMSGYASAILGAWIGLVLAKPFAPAVAESSQRLLPVMAAILALVAFRSAERNSDLASSLKPFPGLAVVSALASGIILLAMGEAFDRTWPAALAGALGAGLAAALTCLALLEMLRSDSLAPSLRRRIAIYGASAEAKELLAACAKDRDAIHCVGVFEDRNPSRVDVTQLACTGRLADLAEQIRRGLIDEVIIALPRAANRRIEEITDELRRYPVDVYACTHTADDFPTEGPSDVSAIGGAGLLRLHRRPIESWGALAKNLSDRILAATLLIALMPLFAVIAAAIKLESKGPVFFKQRRHGLMNETITVWKFRSMRTLDDGPRIVQASKDDPRITNVGAILRKSSLDELPQLINVMRGEMSLVGPRPHAIAHNELYAREIAHYLRRHQVKPGITGWAQINGYRGETPTTAAMRNRVEHDIWYIRNWSIWLDFKILLLTPFYGFVNKNAY